MSVETKALEEQYDLPVRDIVREMGYEIANYVGVPERNSRGHENSFGFGSLGVLEPQGRVRVLGIPLWKKPHHHIATLWMDGRKDGAPVGVRESVPGGVSYGGSWTMDVYGRDNFPQARTIMERICEDFPVEPKFRLRSEEPRPERFYMD